MFKFLKSKKGFTLVELMIVVVIMAILVAVAVPIYSAVTENARKKTCIGNQREIVSSIGNWLMLQSTYKINGSLKTGGGSDDPDWEDDCSITVDGNTEAANAAALKDVQALFKTVPVCPDSTCKITAVIVEGDKDGKANVYVYCDGAATYANKVITAKADGNEHLVPGTYTPAST